MAWFRFIAEANPLIRVFYENNWFTGSNSPEQLKFFFSGGMLLKDYDGVSTGFVRVNFQHSWLDVVWYFASLLVLFFSGFVPGLLFWIFFLLGCFFSCTRFGLFWFLLFRAGLRKKGYKGLFKLSYNARSKDEQSI